MTWTPDEILWYVDEEEVFRIENHIPNEPMYFIANLTIGGSWPGYPDDITQFPKYFEIDYIEIYQLKE